jgi:hypothetical protein
MIETKELDPNLLEAEFYEKDLKLSYSALNKLLIAPSVFYKEYVLKEKEDEFPCRRNANSLLSARPSSF